MKIKTGNEIYLDGCDVREQSKIRKYDDYSTKERSKQHNEKWVAVDDVKELIYLARNNCYGDPNKMAEIIYKSLSTSPKEKELNSQTIQSAKRLCPKCKQGELEIHSGRFICFDCGYSRMIKEDKYEKNKKNTDK